ncbi:hypothetical protein QFZ30_002334 [Arthrobacter pascens]|nr:hypothetical protein [Arthrobacter pascens]
MSNYFLRRNSPTAWCLLLAISVSSCAGSTDPKSSATGTARVLKRRTSPLRRRREAADGTLAPGLPSGPGGTSELAGHTPRGRP